MVPRDKELHTLLPQPTLNSGWNLQAQVCQYRRGLKLDRLKEKGRRREMWSPGLLSPPWRPQQWAGSPLAPRNTQADPTASDTASWRESETCISPSLATSLAMWSDSLPETPHSWSQENREHPGAPVFVPSNACPVKGDY